MHGAQIWRDYMQVTSIMQCVPWSWMFNDGRPRGVVIDVWIFEAISHCVLS